jgi:hypothetical protein
MAMALWVVIDPMVTSLVGHDQGYPGRMAVPLDGKRRRRCLPPWHFRWHGGMMCQGDKKIEIDNNAEWADYRTNNQ